jgi:hypothetical protein
LKFPYAKIRPKTVAKAATYTIRSYRNWCDLKRKNYRLDYDAESKSWRLFAFYYRSSSSLKVVPCQETPTNNPAN